MDWSLAWLSGGIAAGVYIVAGLIRNRIGLVAAVGSILVTIAIWAIVDVYFLKNLPDQKNMHQLDAVMYSMS